MKIETIYKIGDVVRADDDSYGEVIQIRIGIKENKTNIEYCLYNGGNETWWNEELILNIA